MKYFINGKLKETFRRWIANYEGSYLMKLVGIQLLIGKRAPEVIPVYVPFVTVEDHPGQRSYIFNFWRNEQALVVSFFSVFPWINIFISRDQLMDNVGEDE